jgi:hypothetical protein
VTTTPNEAREQANAYLKTQYSAVSTWTTAVLDQVVLHLADGDHPFSMNDIRVIVPEGSIHNAGLYFHGLARRRSPAALEVVGEEPSINIKAHGKGVKVYRLTAAGRRLIEERRELRQAARAARSGRQGVAA